MVQFWPLSLIQNCGHRFKITGISIWWVSIYTHAVTSNWSINKQTYYRLSFGYGKIILFISVFMLALEHSWIFKLTVRGDAVRNSGSPFRRFAFEYAHFWQGCRYVCQLPITGLTSRVSWQVYLAWTSEVKLAEHSNTQLTRVSYHLLAFRTRLSYIRIINWYF